jgi:MFS family permease
MSGPEPKTASLIAIYGNEASYSWNVLEDLKAAGASYTRRNIIADMFRRLGVKVMLLIGMLAWFVRYAMFALGVSEEGRILLYLGILLHGVCYDFFFVVGFIYTDRVAGEKVKGQAQSMIVMFTYGIGMLLGSQISGALYNRLVAGQTVPQAWVTFWWIPAVAAAAIALIFLLTFKYDDDKA